MPRPSRPHLDTRPSCCTAAARAGARCTACCRRRTRRSACGSASPPRTCWSTRSTGTTPRPRGHLRARRTASRAACLGPTAARPSGGPCPPPPPHRSSRWGARPLARGVCCGADPGTCVPPQPVGWAGAWTRHCPQVAAVFAVGVCAKTHPSPSTAFPPSRLAPRPAAHPCAGPRTRTAAARPPARRAAGRPWSAATGSGSWCARPLRGGFR